MGTGPRKRITKRTYTQGSQKDGMYNIIVINTNEKNKIVLLLVFRYYVFKKRIRIRIVLHKLLGMTCILLIPYAIIAWRTWIKTWKIKTNYRNICSNDLSPTMSDELQTNSKISFSNGNYRNIPPLLLNEFFFLQISIKN